MSQTRATDGNLTRWSDSVAITGIGESDFSEGGGNRADTLIYDACQRAITDAGLDPDDVDGIVSESKLMPETVTHAELAESLGVPRRYSATSTHLMAGCATAPLLAAQAIESGLANHVLCYFGVDWASQRERTGSSGGGPYNYHIKQPEKRVFEVPFGWIPQPVYFAARTRRHMYEYGTSEEALAEIAVQTRANATQNEKAAKRTPITREDYFENPIIADPLRILDCCLISDGAGAFVISAPEDTQRAPTPPVYVKGVGYDFDQGSSETTFMSQSDLGRIPAKNSAEMAFRMAGLGPDEVDFAELYDCFTIATISQLEDLGFCEKGAGGQFVLEKGISVDDGALPVNTHGGNLSQAYLLGISHITETVKQLRGTADNQVENAEIGLASGWGGIDHGTLILGSEEA
jgi:acetyl-CoA acetyltransferase